ncbi:hypothetical protein Glove_344g16 [Diversispora epigaea]|uniref:RING-type domain-containing protein n=1 Tax=Diversispora epigaea TaxID=1348612 RepID=A0A397HIX1_9GLOM|nr:hypothetical protein Glove_344g16 [Diversispora epigaea]
MATEKAPETSSKNDAEVFQLEALSLNYLRSQNISAIPDEDHIPKLRPCILCNKAILNFQFEAFTVLCCGHLLHRICLESYIMRGGARSPSCPICNWDIEINREELGLASGEYAVLPAISTRSQILDRLSFLALTYLRLKLNGKASQQSNVTIDDDDGGDLEEMIKLRLIVDKSSEQDTSLIDNEKGTSNMEQVNSTDQDNINKTTDTQERGSSPIVDDDDEQDLSKDTDERDIVQSLLGELSTPIKGETVEAMIDEDENNKNSAPKNLSILYQKACRAEMRVMKAKQEEITCWYYYGKGFEERVEAILNNERGVRDQSARNRVYNEIVQHIPGYLKDNLRKKTQRAVKIYKLFRNIGVNKIKRILSYGANSISKLTITQIQLIEQHFCKAENENSGHV